jgi:hypothetical protein
MPAGRPPDVPRRAARAADPRPAAATVRMRRAARRHRALRVPWRRRRSLSAKQLRPPRLPPGLQRPLSPRDQAARPADHRRRLGLARHPRSHLTVGSARCWRIHHAAGAGESSRSPRRFRSPGSLGRIPTRPSRRRHPLTRPAARPTFGAVPRASGTTRDRQAADDTGGQGEDDLPNSSQPCRAPATEVGWGSRNELLTRSETGSSGWS